MQVQCVSTSRDKEHLRQEHGYECHQGRGWTDHGNTGDCDKSPHAGAEEKPDAEYDSARHVTAEE